MTELQSLLLSAIKIKARNTGDSTITYCTEWFGYLPFGLYHWLEYNGEDFTRELPEGWGATDIESLEQQGFLVKVSFWQNPKDEAETKTVYRVSK